MDGRWMGGEMDGGRVDGWKERRIFLPTNQGDEGIGIALLISYLKSFKTEKHS